MTTGTVIFLVLLLLGIVTAWKGIKTVPQGEVWTVERFGAFTRLLHPGLNLIIPYVDTIGRRMNVQEVVLDIPEQSVITRDNATVAVDGIVYYRVMDAAKAVMASTNDIGTRGEEKASDRDEEAAGGSVGLPWPGSTQSGVARWCYSPRLVGGARGIGGPVGSPAGWT